MICDEDCTKKFLFITNTSTVIMTLFACFLVVRLSIRHITHFTNPIFQKKIIVIIYIIPFYALNSMITTLWVSKGYISEILSIVRAMYEAVVIISFFQLIVAFLCYREEDGVKMERMYQALKDKGELRWSWPLNWVFPSIKITTRDKGRCAFKFLRNLALQYAIINLLLSLVSIVILLISKGEVLTDIVNALKLSMFVSVGFAIYSLILYLYNFIDNIRQYKPFWKFFSIKTTLFLSVWQVVTLKVLNVREFIKLDEKVTGGLNSEDYIENVLVVLEMLLLALIATSCYSHEEYNSTVAGITPQKAENVTLPKIFMDHVKDTARDMRDTFSVKDTGCYADGRGDIQKMDSHPKEYEDLEIMSQDELEDKKKQLERGLCSPDKQAREEETETSA